VRSDCFVYSEREGLRINPARASAGREETVKIRLDRKYYGKFDQMEARFPEGVPSLVECDALTIHGDVHFESDVTIRGAVTITNPGSTPTVVKRKTVIDRDVNFSPALQSNPAGIVSQPC